VSGRGLFIDETGRLAESAPETSPKACKRRRHRGQERQGQLARQRHRGHLENSTQKRARGLAPLLDAVSREPARLRLPRNAPEQKHDECSLMIPHRSRWSRALKSVRRRELQSAFCARASATQRDDTRAGQPLRGALLNQSSDRSSSSTKHRSPELDCPRRSIRSLRWLSIGDTRPFRRFGSGQTRTLGAPGRYVRFTPYERTSSARPVRSETCHYGS
jgi:hypothetical protein